MSDDPRDDTVLTQAHAPRGPLKRRVPVDPTPQTGPTPRGHRGPRCTAYARNTGKTCTQPAMRGCNVCKMHGGKAPQVMASAAERLRALQHPAIDRMAKLIDQEEFPTVAYAASRDVLDRTLGKPHESVAVAHSGGLVLRHELSDED